MTRLHWRLRFRDTIWFFTFLSLLGACLPSGEDFASQSPLLAALEKKSGLIAYVGGDGNIYTIDQGGGKQQAITTDAVIAEGEEEGEAQFYLLPTWSPDGNRLAFAGVSGSLSNPTNTTIHTGAADGSGLTEVFDSDSVRPIYLHWSPSGESVTFLTTAPSGALLLQMATAGGTENQVLDAGQPFYWAWAPDGSRLLIHAGGANESRLSFLTPGERVIEEGLEIRPASFQAPSWTADGDKLIVAAINAEGGGTLVTTDMRGEIQSTLVGLGQRPVSFAVSPDGGRVGFVAGDPGSTEAVLGRLTVIDIEQPDEVVVAEGEQVVAFFWSPNSEKIAYFVPGRVSLSSDSDTSDEENTVVVLSLYIFDVDDETSERISVFRPTPEFLSILPFFDQFHHSATIWSPDSQNLVLTAFTGSEIPKVLVVNASGKLDPRPIADGYLAFWSWK